MVWDDEGRGRCLPSSSHTTPYASNLYWEEMEREMKGGIEQRLNQEWDRMENRIKEAMGRMEREIRKDRTSKKSWWDEECRLLKK